MADDTTKPDNTKPDDSSGLAAFFKQQQTMMEKFSAAGEKSLEERKAVTDKMVPELEALTQKELDIAGKPIAMPRTPHLQAIPQAPQPKFEDPFNAFGNPLVIMASIGSLFTRTPAIAALNAGAAAMNAYHEGNKEKIELTRQNFEDKLRTVIAQNEQEMQLYNAEMQKTHLSMSDRMARMSAIAHAFQNKEVIASLQIGNADAAFKLIDAQMSAQNTINQQMMHYQEFQQRRQDLEQQRATQNLLAQERIDAMRERQRETAAGARAQYSDEAKTQVEALEANESVNRGGITITPDMWKKYKEMKTPPIGYTPAQKAMEEMRKAAAGIGAPGRHGPQQTPTPQPQMVPGAPIQTPRVAQDLDDGTPFRYGNAVYEKHGDRSIYIDTWDAYNARLKGNKGAAATTTSAPSTLQEPNPFAGAGT